MRENEFMAIVNRNNQRLYLISLSYTKKQHGHRGYYAECFYEAKGFI